MNVDHFDPGGRVRADRRPVLQRVLRLVLALLPIVLLAGVGAVASFSVQAIRSPSVAEAACNGWPSSGGVPPSGHDFFDFSSGSGTWSDGDLKVRLPSTYTCSTWLRTYTYNGMSTATGAHWYWKRFMTSAGGTTNCNYAGSGTTDYMMADGCGDASFSVVSGAGISQNTTYANFGVGYASCSTDYGANVGWWSNATPGANCGTPATRIPDGSPPKFDWTNPSAPTVTVTPGANSWLSGTTLYVNGTTGGFFTSAASGSTDTGGSGLSNYTQTLSGTTTGWNPTSSTSTSQSFSWTSALVDAQSTTLSVRSTDVAGNTSTAVTRTLASDETAPAFTSFTAPTLVTTYQTATGFTFTWTAATDGGSGVASYQRLLQSAPIASAGVCSTTWTDAIDHGLSSATSQAEASGTLTAGLCWRLAVAARDQVVNIAGRSYSNPILVDTTAPTAPTITNDTASQTCSSAVSATATTIHIRPACGGSFTLTASATDNESGVASYAFGTLSAPTGWTVSGSGSSRTYTFTGTSGSSSVSITATNNAGLVSSPATLNFVVDSTVPAISFTAPAAGGPVQATSPYTVTFAASDAASGFGKSGSGWSLQRQVATFTGSCGTFANDPNPGNQVSGVTSGSSLTSVQTLQNGSCYRWVLNATDNVGNAASSVTSGSIQVGSIPTVVVTDNTASLGNAYRSGGTVFYRSTGSGSVQLTATGSDPGSTISSNTFGPLTGTPTGWSPTSSQTSTANPYGVTYGWSSASPTTSTSVTTRNALGLDSAAVVITFTPDGAAPTASFTAPVAGQASQSTTPFTVTFTASDSGSGLGKTGSGWSLQRQIASASNNVCGSFTNDSASGNLVTGTTSGSGQTSSQTLVTGNCYQWVLSVTDSVGLTSSAMSGAVLVDTSAPSAPAVADNGPAGSYRTGDTIFFRPSAGSTLTLTSTGTDAVSGIASSTFGALSASTGWTYTPGTVSGNPAPRSLTWSATGVSATLPVSTTNNVGSASAARTITLTADAAAPAISNLLPAAGTSSQTTTSVTVSWTETETGSGMATRGLQRQSVAAASAGACATATFVNDGGLQNVTSPITVSGLSGNTCYRWTLLLTDNVGNVSTLATSGMVFIVNTAPPTPGTPDLDTASDSGPKVASDGVAYVYPVADVIKTSNWTLTPSTPTTGWDKIDEYPASTADNLYTTQTQNPATYIAQFGDPGLTSADIITGVTFSLTGGSDHSTWVIRNPDTGIEYPTTEPALRVRPWDGKTWTVADVAHLQYGYDGGTASASEIDRMVAIINYTRFGTDGAPTAVKTRIGFNLTTPSDVFTNITPPFNLAPERMGVTVTLSYTATANVIRVNCADSGAWYEQWLTFGGATNEFHAWPGIYGNNCTIQVRSEHNGAIMSTTAVSYTFDDGVVSMEPTSAPYRFDNITNDNTPSFSGTNGLTATSVELYRDGVLVGTDTSVSSGTWNITASTVADGPHAFTVKAINGSDASPASPALSVTIDTAAPAAPSTPDLSATTDNGVSGTDNITSNPTPIFSGTAGAGASIVGVFDGVQWIGADPFANTDHAAVNPPAHSFALTVPGTPYGNGFNLTPMFYPAPGDPVTITITKGFAPQGGNMGLICSTNNQNDYTIVPAAPTVINWTAQGGTCYLYTWSTYSTLTGGGWVYSPSIPTQPPYISGTDGYYVNTSPTRFTPAQRSVTATGYDIAGNSATSAALPVTMTEYLNALSSSSQRNASVGEAVYMVASTRNEQGNAVIDYNGTVTVTAQAGSGAVFPDGNTYALSAAAGVSGHAFRVLFGNPGTWTLTLTGPNISTTTQQVTVTASHLAASAPATAYVGVAIPMNVKAKNVANKPIPGYNGLLTFTSSDTGATYVSGPDSYGTYRMACGCGDGHDVMVTFATVGTQTVTTTDEFGNTTQVTVNVLPAPGAIAVPAGLEVYAIQWANGHMVDYYIKNTSGLSLTVVKAWTGCSAPGDPHVTEENIPLTKAYTQFSTHIATVRCWIGGSGAYAYNNVAIKDDAGHVWAMSATLYTQFSDLPNSSSFTSLDDGDPLTDVSVNVVSKLDGPISQVPSPDGSGNFFNVIRGGLTVTITSSRSIRLLGYAFPGQPSITDWGPESDRQGKYIAAGTNTYVLDYLPWACYFGIRGQETLNLHYIDLSNGHDGDRQFAVGPPNVGPPATLCDAPNGGGAYGTVGWESSGSNNPFNFDSYVNDFFNKAAQRAGDPVDVFSGSQTADVVDFSLGGLSPALTLSRSYKSVVADMLYRGKAGAHAQQRLFGNGWSTLYDTNLNFPDANTVGVWGPNGAYTFVLKSGGTWDPSNNGTDKLTAISGGWKITSLDGSSLRFDTNGRLAAVTDITGRELVLGWASGKLATLTDANDRVANITTNAAGEITRIDLPGGRYTAYTYDANGYLHTFRNLAGTTHTYNTDVRGRIATVTDAASNILLSNVFDETGRVVAQYDALNDPTFFNYDDHAFVNPINYQEGETALTRTVIAADGGSSISCYNTKGLLLGTVDALGGVNTYVHDAQGNVASSRDELGYTSSAKYDAKHEVTNVTDPLGHTSTMAWDSFGHPTVITANGTTTTTTFDPTTHLPTTVVVGDGTHTQQQAAYTYDPTTKLPTTLTGPGGVASTMHYDSFGYVDYSIDPTGHKTTFVVDHNTGLVSSSVDALGNAAGGVPGDHRTTYTYDDAGHVLTVTDPLGNMAGGNAAAHRTTYAYDSMGRLKTISRASGAITTYNYNLAGQMTSMVVKIDATHDATTSCEYDAMGRLAAVVDPENRRTETTYDLNGQAVAVKDGLGKSASFEYDAKGRVTKSTDRTNKSVLTFYDELDRVIKTRAASGDEVTYVFDPTTGVLSSSTDARQNQTSYGYDWLGRATSVTNAKQQTSSTTYDSRGNIATATNNRNKTTTFTYNDSGQLLTVVEPGDSGNFTTTYTYDAAGRLHTRQNDRGAVETYDYDALNRPTQMTDAATKTWKTFYADDGQVDHTLSGKGERTDFSYDLAGRLTRVVGADAASATIDYAYDKANQVLTMADANGTTSYGYDADGRVTSVSRAGRTTAYAYDDAGRPLTVTYPGSLGAVNYGYDTSGRLSTITDWASRVTTYHYGAGSLVSSVDRPGGLTTSYSYDELDRPLTAVSTRSSATILSQAWTYDPNGNIATLTDDTGTATFSYDNLDRLLTASYPSAQSYSYAYDSVGNTLTATTPAGSTAYTYDLADHITSVGPGAAPDATAPTVPSAVAATAVGSGRVNVSWTASTDASGVTRYTISRGGSPIATVAGTATSFSDFSVLASTSYSYTVTASDAAGNTSAASSAANATTSAVDTIAPTVPASPSAAAVGFGRVNVSWTASTDGVGVTGYTILRGGTAIATVPGNVVAFSDFSVAASTAYVYTVKASDAAGNTSAASANANVTSAADPGVPGSTSAQPPTTNDAGWTTSANGYASDDAYATTAPNKNQTGTVNYGTFGFGATIPANATITGVTVSVEWKVSVNTSIATLGSQLYSGGVAKGSEFTNTAMPTTDTVQTYPVSGLTRADLLDGALTIRVRASRGNSNTAFTASVDAVNVTVTYTTPTAPDATNPSVPTGLTATVNGTNRIDLAWTASTDNIAVQGYKIFRDGTQVGTIVTGAAAFFDTGVVAGLHAYTVAAVDGAGNASSQSSSASATAAGPTLDATAPTIPTGLTATANGNARIDLAWAASTDAAPGVQGYKIFRDTVQVGTLISGTTSFFDTGISAGPHVYTVAAVDGAGNTSAQSTSASATATAGVGVAAAPTYDDNGNMTSDGTYGNRTYTYDTLGRLTGVTGGGATTTYALDGAGNRWGQTTNGVTTSFDLDLAAGNATILYDGTRKFLPGAPGSGYESAGVWKNNLTDLIGSSVMSVDTAGVISGVVHYDPYGAPRPGNTASAGIGYAGEYRDATGLVNLRARSYDPVLGRFVGRDTFAGVVSAPQTGNRYAYATSNPLRYTDPSGRFVQAAIDNAPTILEIAITFNPAGAVMVFGYQLLTGTDPATGEHVDPNMALLGVAAVFAPPAIAKALSKAFGSLTRGLGNVVGRVAGIGSRAITDVFVGAREVGAGLRALKAEAGAIARLGGEARGAESAGARVVAGADRGAPLYRAVNAQDVRTLAEARGITAKNPTGNWTLQEHILGEPPSATWTSDPWISTTPNPTVAEVFNRHGIVVIDPTRLVTPALKAAEHLQQGTLARTIAESEEEISIFGHIPQDAIIGFIR